MSPDGKYVIGVRDGQALLVSLDGAGQSRVLPDLSAPGDRIVQWSADSHRLYDSRRGEPPARVSLYEMETGRRQPWKDVPVDATIQGLMVRMTRDGRAWAYSGQRSVGDLYVVDGLR